MIPFRQTISLITIFYKTDSLFDSSGIVCKSQFENKLGIQRRYACYLTVERFSDCALSPFKFKFSALLGFFHYILFTGMIEEVYQRILEIIGNEVL